MNEILNRVPTHVSIIMDGNGRWAAERGKPRTFGHKAGVESVRKITEASIEFGVRYLSLFAFSEENWGRPDGEVSTLMELATLTARGEMDNFIRNGVCFRILGNIERLPAPVRAAMKKLEEATSGNSRLTLIVFISYSGKWDILQALKKLASAGPEAVDNLSFEDIDNSLVTAGIPDPDLVIRTSGEKRISNYLLWQLAYSEFVFTDTLWPDFGREEYLEALKEFESRDRRFGKVK